MKKQTAGFTMIELMISIAIIAIMAAIAFPNMRNFVINTRITNRTEQISNLLRFAKTEAIRRNAPVIVCGTKIRNDGRPLNNNCSAADISSGMRAFVDMNRNGIFDSTSDIDLRTISINGNSSQQLTVTPTVFKVNKSAVTQTADTVNQFVFTPSGTVGRKTEANNFNNIEIGQSYIRFLVSESGDMNETKKLRSLIVAVNPTGKIDTCRSDNRADYEQPDVCTIQ